MVLLRNIPINYIRQVNGVKLGGYTVFTLCVCLSVCAHSVPLVWMGGLTYCSPRNVGLFDSCVKSWYYFRTDKILLETSFYWLSYDIVRFKIEVGISEKCTKCNSNITQNRFTAARRAAMTSWHRPAKGSFIRHYCVANSLGGCTLWAPSYTGHAPSCAFPELWSCAARYGSVGPQNDHWYTSGGSGAVFLHLLMKLSDQRSWICLEALDTRKTTATTNAIIVTVLALTPICGAFRCVAASIFSHIDGRS